MEETRKAKHWKLKRTSCSLYPSQCHVVILAGYKMSRVVRDVSEFYFANVGEVKRSLNVVITASGWLAGSDDKPSMLLSAEVWV